MSFEPSVAATFFVGFPYNRPYNWLWDFPTTDSTVNSEAFPTTDSTIGSGISPTTDSTFNSEASPTTGSTVNSEVSPTTGFTVNLTSSGYKKSHCLMWGFQNFRLPFIGCT
jgi:hypothetical protein